MKNNRSQIFFFLCVLHFFLAFGCAASALAVETAENDNTLFYKTGYIQIPAKLKTRFEEIRAIAISSDSLSSYQNDIKSANIAHSNGSEITMLEIQKGISFDISTNNYYQTTLLVAFQNEDGEICEHCLITVLQDVGKMVCALFPDEASSVDTIYENPGVVYKKECHKDACYPILASNILLFFGVLWAKAYQSSLGFPVVTVSIAEQNCKEASFENRQ